MLRLYEFEIKK